MSEISSSEMNTVKVAKTLLRRNITSALKNMTVQDCEEQSKFLQKELMRMKEWKEAKRISIYLSMKKEVHTDLLVESALHEGKECFVPWCYANRMKMLKLKDLEDLKMLPKNSWGIKEPKPIEGRADALETGGLDLVVVPGVAFTTNGIRLGHGKGYYDQFLEELKKVQNDSPSKTIALAFHQQIVKEVPFTHFDVKIDEVVYPMGPNLNF